jgi:hypothetical protein
MARTTNRAGGHVVTAAPAQRPASEQAMPATQNDPANGVSHPTSRKPNAPTAGGGHGNSGQGGGGSK